MDIPKISLRKELNSRPIFRSNPLNLSKQSSSNPIFKVSSLQNKIGASSPKYAHNMFDCIETKLDHQITERSSLKIKFKSNNFTDITHNEIIKKKDKIKKKSPDKLSNTEQQHNKASLLEVNNLADFWKELNDEYFQMPCSLVSKNFNDKLEECHRGCFEMIIESESLAPLYFSNTKNSSRNKKNHPKPSVLYHPPAPSRCFSDLSNYPYDPYNLLVSSGSVDEPFINQFSKKFENKYLLYLLEKDELFYENYAKSSAQIHSTLKQKNKLLTLPFKKYKFDIKPRFQNVIQLGKRGRNYLEVWEEEAFLHKQNDFLTLALNDWSKLLHGYHDDFDGAFRSFMLLSHSRKKSKLSHMSKKSLEDDLAFFPSPPVPVSCHHPAAWGISSRVHQRISSNGQNNIELSLKSINSQVMHPASFSESKVLPVITTQNESCNFEDLDFLNLEAIKNDNEIKITEAINYARMFDLERVYNSTVNSEKMTILRDKMRNILCSIASGLIGKILVSYHKPAISDSSSASMRRIRIIKDRPSGSIYNDFIYGNTKYDSANERKGINDDLNMIHHLPGSISKPLGACLACNIPFGSFVVNLKVTDKVEAELRNGWRLCLVIGKRYEGTILRNIKVIPKILSPFEAEWLSVEDGKIAPLGTHFTDNFIKLYY